MKTIFDKTISMMTTDEDCDDSISPLEYVLTEFKDNRDGFDALTSLKKIL